MLDEMEWRAHSEAIGLWAGALTTLSFVPQVARTWRSGGHGLSWGMLALFGVGVGLWLIYGLLVESQPVILANAFTLAQIVLIAGLKLWKREPHA